MGDFYRQRSSLCQSYQQANQCSTKVGKWETVDHWPSGVEEAGKHPAP